MHRLPTRHIGPDIGAQMLRLLICLVGFSVALSSHRTYGYSLPAALSWGGAKAGIKKVLIDIPLRSPSNPNMDFHYATTILFGAQEEVKGSGGSGDENFSLG